jgi:fatty acid-binding protein DegV
LPCYRSPGRRSSTTPLVHVVTDSSCHIPLLRRQKPGIHVTPFPYTRDGETYLDIVDMSPPESYARLRESSTLPTTSGPTPGAFLQISNKLTHHDGEIVLAILVGSQISSTYSSGELARQELPDQSIV